MAGSIVRRGHGKGLVVSLPPHVEAGRLARLIHRIEKGQYIPGQYQEYGDDDDDDESRYKRRKKQRKKVKKMRQQQQRQEESQRALPRSSSLSMLSTGSGGYRRFSIDEDSPFKEPVTVRGGGGEEEERDDGEEEVSPLEIESSLQELQHGVLTRLGLVIGFLGLILGE